VCFDEKILRGITSTNRLIFSVRHVLRKKHKLGDTDLLLVNRVMGVYLKILERIENDKAL